MVKKIRKRTGKKKKQEQVDAVNQEGGVVENQDSSDVSADNALVETDEATRLSLAEQLQREAQAELAEGGDRFEEVAEQVLTSIAMHWKTIVVLGAIVASLYGFVRLSQNQARQGQAQDRAQLMDAQKTYKSALAEQVLYAKKQVKWYQDNPNAFTSPNVGQPPSNDLLKKSASAFSTAKTKVGPQGQVLAQLGEASAQYDLASSEQEYQKVGDLFGAIAQNQAVDGFTRGIAYQNAAVSYEQANKLGAALKNWQQLDQLNHEVYGLFAQSNQARILAKDGKVKEAKAQYTRVQADYKDALQKSENQALKNQIKIALARLNAR